MFICLTLNHGEGPKGWHLICHQFIDQALATPGLKVLVSKNSDINSMILEEDGLKAVPLPLALDRMRLIIKCYRPMFESDLSALWGLSAPNAHNTPTTPTDASKHMMGEGPL